MLRTVPCPDTVPHSTYNFVYMRMDIFPLYRVNMLKKVACQYEPYIQNSESLEGAHWYAWKLKVRILICTSDTFLYFAELAPPFPPPPSGGLFLLEPLWLGGGGGVHTPARTAIFHMHPLHKMINLSVLG